MVTSYDDRIGLSIVILDNDENTIKWLDPELCEIKETCSIDKPRQIEITYPIMLDELNLDGGNWYDAGNKVYIPNTLGINSCLYVINTDYDLDYWKENTIHFTAEEVLTELNYNMVGFLTQVTKAPSTDENNEEEEQAEEEEDEDEITSGQMIEKTFSEENNYVGTQIFKYKDKIEITSEVLTQFFGYYYEITGLDALDNQKKYISPSGTMTYMSLFRLIEEQTERVFVTEYVNNNNKISRRLSLRNYQNMRRVAQTELLDLNYNLDSLELNVSEENTYTAMAPEFTDNSTVVDADTSQTAIDTGASLSTTAQNASSNIDTTSSKSISEVIQDWLDYEVEPRQEHPMIIQKDTAGNLVEVATWYAPFRKLRGNLAITSERQTESNYNQIVSYDKQHTSNKCGKVSTSETIPQIIYNTLANALLNKLSPVYDLKIDVKDIQELMGIPNLSYELYETLQVRIPNFDYYVPCRITGTVKNPHKPGENKITVETDIKSMRNLHDTEIISSDMIINDTNLANIGGILQSEEVGLADKLVTINIKLVQAYADDASGITPLSIQQAAKKFDPENETYIFPKEEIIKLPLLLLQYNIWVGQGKTGDEISNLKPSFNMRTITGEIISVPRHYQYLIWYAYSQAYDLNRKYSAGSDEDKFFHGGSYDKNLTVHLYPLETLNRELSPLYILTQFAGKTNSERIAHFKKYLFSSFYWNVEKLSNVAIQHGLLAQGYWYYDALNFSESQIGGTCVAAAASMAYTYVGGNVMSNEFKYTYGGDLSSGNAISDIFNKFTDGARKGDWLPGLFPNKELLDTIIYFSGYTKSEFYEEVVQGTFTSINPDSNDPRIKGYSVRQSIIVGVDVQLLQVSGYYKGLYSISQNENNTLHAVVITAWKIVNGVKYVFVQDGNFPIFSPDQFGAAYDVTDGWVRWDVFSNAIVLDFRKINGKLFDGHSSSGTIGGLIWFVYTYFDTISVKESSIVDIPGSNSNVLVSDVVPLDLTNATYLFKSKDVQNAINEVYKYYIEQGMKHEINSISTNIVSVVGQKHNLKMRELMGLAYSYMYYYQNNSNRQSSNIDLRYGKQEDSQKYIDHMETVYDYFTPVYPQQKRYENHYIISSLLFHLGVLSSPLDFFEDNTGEIKFNDMINEIISRQQGLTCFIRDFTENILRSVVEINQSHNKFMSTVVIVYAYSDRLATSAQYMSNRYPLLVYNIHDDIVDYCNLAARGNSPGFNYNTDSITYGHLNPWGTTSLQEILEWVDAAKENNPNNDSCLIVSRYLTTGSV